MQSNMCKKSSFRCRGSRKDLSDFCRVTLATVSCHVVYHDMLAVSFAAILGHLDTFGTLLHTGKTRPCQKRKKGQGNYTHCPEAMFLMLHHLVAL
jgi:hypothetical protein